MKSRKPLYLCIIENLKARHEKLWFVLRDIFPEETATIIPGYNQPCSTWDDAKKLISSLPNAAELIVFTDLALLENDINDARAGVEECRRLHQLRPDATFIATTGFESVLDEHPKAKDPFSLILLKKDPVWDKPDSELAAYLREKIEIVRSSAPPSGAYASASDAKSNAANPKKLVFVSHCHDDGDLAEAVVELLCAGLRLRRADFRCTSLDGAALAGGTRTDDQLREEIRTAPSFISLLTPKAIKKFYVLFELGARWGLKGPHIPLLARGATGSFLKDPLKATVALDLTVKEKALSLVNDLGVVLGKTPEPVNSYLGKVRTVVRLAKMERQRGRDGHQ